MKNIFTLMVVFVFSCSWKKDNNVLVYARVENEILNQKNIVIPSFPNEANNNLSSFVNSWVDETVLFISAKKTGLLSDNDLIKKRDSFYKNLIISSFVENETVKNISISNEEIKIYYEKNKNSFLYRGDVVFAEQYISKNPKDAKSLLLSVRSNRLNNINKIPHQFEYGQIKKGIFSSETDSQVFNKKNKVVGPIKKNDLYYVLKILKIHKKGSQRGLEEVYDEIYQRIYKKKQAFKYSSLLDSLKNSMNVYINQDM